MCEHINILGDWQAKVVKLVSYKRLHEVTEIPANNALSEINVGKSSALLSRLGTGMVCFIGLHVSVYRN